MLTYAHVCMHAYHYIPISQQCRTPPTLQPPRPPPKKNFQRDAWFDPIRPDHSIIAVGDMKGVGIVLKFNEATTRLFNEVPKWQENQCALKNLEVAPENMRGQPTRVQVFQYQLHIEDGEDMMNQSSLKMMYIPELEGFYSCAKTKKKSLVFFTLDTEKDVKDRTRSFDIPKGCNSFDFFYTDTSKDGHHLIITGGNDKIVRFWNPYVPTYPVATLTGHRSTIVCVMANSVNKQVITLAEEEIIKIWDVEARVCLNTLGSMIPHHLVQYSSDTSSKCMWHEQTQTMLITTYTELACIMMSRDNVTAIHSSHDMPVSCTTYIAEFNIVATGCVAGTIICWDLSSGGKIISYDHAHGSAVSTLAVCVGGRRLLSGASNGEIYVWGTLSGMLLQKLVKELPSEVTGIFSTHHRIYSAGWDRKLISFVADNDIDLAKAPSIINQDLKWDPAERHNEDITSMDSCGESLVATGAYDGMIIIWNVKLAKAVNQFDSKSFRVHLHMERFADSDANAPAIAGQKGFLPEVHSNSRPSVDVVVWLGARIKKMAASRMRGENSDDGLNVASLAVACDGGCVNFWNAIKGDLLGGFHAVADKHGPDFVSSMAVNRDNTLLYTGDSIGHLRIYDISTYCVAGRDSKPPRVIEEWRAHMMSISALYYVESAKLLITASLDQSVRVWNGNTGVFIGTFGGSTWSLPIKGRPSIAAVSHVSLSHKAATQFRRTAIAKKKPSDTIEDEDENDGSDGSNGNGSTAVRVSATEAGRAGDRGTSKATLPPVPEVDESEEKKKRKKKKRNSSVPQKKGAGGGGGDDGAELEFPALKKAEMQVENLSEAEASHWDNKMRGSHRATAIGAAILGRDFALPRIKKENEDFDVNEYQESKGILGSMASRMVQDDKFKTTAQGRAVGASFQPLDWERECVLGKAFSKRAHKHHNEKQEWRKLTPRPDVRKSEISGQ